LPGSTGSGGPTAGASHPRPVPVSRFLPRSPGFPWVVPVSDVKVFLLLQSRAAQAPEGSNRDFFFYPQNDGGYPRISEVIHHTVHSISTGHRPSAVPTELAAPAADPGRAIPPARQPSRRLLLWINGFVARRVRKGGKNPEKTDREIPVIRLTPRSS
jgi:hypothetical protein